jgi:hypothetical protein
MLLEPFGGPGRRLPAQPGSSNKWVARGTISSRQIDDLEPALTRHGYDVRTLADRFNVKPIEIRPFWPGTLHAERTRELTEAMNAAGVPV